MSGQPLSALATVLPSGLGEAILATARRLAFPRYPGTDGDRVAIRLVAAELERAGLEVEVQAFSYDLRPAFRALRLSLVLAAGLLAASGILAARLPLLALLLLLAAILVGGALLLWMPGREGLYSRPGPTETANVAGWRRVDRPRITVILLAHHDSKSQSLTLPWRLGATVTAMLAALMLLAAILDGLTGTDWLPRHGPVVAGTIAAAALSLLSTMRNGNRSPGGVDNAGSLATVLELARHLPELGHDDVQWIFLSPGAEEDHMVGAMRWLDAHRGDLEPETTWALNLDGLGNPGPLVWLTHAGLGRARSLELSGLARRCAEDAERPLRFVTLPPGMGVDAIPFAQRGYRCATLSSGSLNRATVAVHSAGDHAGNLDGGTLQRGAHLALELALRLCAREEAG